MLNMKNIFAAAALSLAAMSSVNATEIELDNFEYQGPNTVFIGVDGDDVPTNAATGLSGSVLAILTLITTGDIINLPITEASAVAQTTNQFFTADVNFDLTLDSDPSLATDITSFALVSNGITEDGLNTTLVFDEASGIDATLAITYSDSAGGLFDISTFDAFYVDVLNAFEGLDLSLLLTDSFENTGELEFNSNQETATGTRVLFDFTSLADEIDLTSIAEITATINSPGVAADLILTSLGLVRVPEPAALAIFGLALLGFGVRRRNA